MPSPFGGRQTSLGPPKSKNRDHFSIVIWALRSTFAKQVFWSINFLFFKFFLSEQSFYEKRSQRRKKTIMVNTCLAAKGALAHCLQHCTACNAAPPATPHRLQNPKWPPGGRKMADGVWKRVQSLVIGRSGQLLLNNFFDPSNLLFAFPLWGKANQS